MKRSRSQLSEYPVPQPTSKRRFVPPERKLPLSKEVVIARMPWYHHRRSSSSNIARYSSSRMQVNGLYGSDRSDCCSAGCTICALRIITRRHHKRVKSVKVLNRRLKLKNWDLP